MKIMEELKKRKEEAKLERGNKKEGSSFEVTNR